MKTSVRAERGFHAGANPRVDELWAPCPYRFPEHKEGPAGAAGRRKVATMSSLTTDLVLLGVVVAVIASQLKGMTIGTRRLVVLPAVLTVLSAVDLGGPEHVSATDIEYIAASAAIAAAVGVAQGAAMRLKQRSGALWGQMPPWGLWLWAALVVSRLAVYVIADARGATVAASFGAIVLTLGINRLAQSGVMALWALEKGIPIPLGSTGGGLVSGLLGGRRTW
jgi:hypothetical protein